MRKHLLAASGILSCSILAQAAPANCPWFTQGSAAALLGGEVTSTVLAKSADSGTCHFSRQDGDATYSLDIMVQQDLPSPCRADKEKLAGLGTAATGCTVEHSNAALIEQIDAQVRDQHFASVLEIRGAKLSMVQQQTFRSLFHQAAEQIAGNLF